MFQYVIGPFFITVEITFQQIGKKEESQNGKHNEKFDQDNGPESPTPGHPPEPIQIEIIDFFEHLIGK